MPAREIDARTSPSNRSLTSVSSLRLTNSRMRFPANQNTTSGEAPVSQLRMDFL